MFKSLNNFAKNKLRIHYVFTCCSCGTPHKPLTPVPALSTVTSVSCSVAAAGAAFSFKREYQNAPPMQQQTPQALRRLNACNVNANEEQWGFGLRKGSKAGTSLKHMAPPTMITHVLQWPSTL